MNSFYIVSAQLNDVSVEYDKVWVSSFDQYYTDCQKTDTEKKKQVSEIAFCNSAFMYEDEPYLRNGYN